MKRSIVLIGLLVLILAALLASSLALTACSERTFETNSDTSQTAGTMAETSISLDIDDLDMSLAADDTDESYDPSSATVITLSDAGTNVVGSGAAVSGKVLTISQAGTYIVSGSLSDGRLVVDATKVDTVHLVLDGVQIASSDGCAIQVDQAGKVILTLADGSVNTTIDAPSYVSTGDNDPDAAIYSSDDLSINGSGTLVVNGSYKHAIKSADSLVITGGQFELTAAQDALKGTDSIHIAGGSFSLDAGSDAIESSNDEDDDSGWVYIAGGTFTIRAGDNGIQGATALVIDGGQITVEASGDTLHSNGSIRIEDGTLLLNAGDDGVHADDTLVISGGSLTISSSYEGLEAATVTIAGGTNRVMATDDGINAAGGNDSDQSPGDMFRSTGDYRVCISGGYTYVNANGDGVDSNGDIEILGGTLVVDGPTANNNAAMDIEQGTFVVTGGTLIASGSSGMLVTPTSATQPVVTIVFSQTQSAGDLVGFSLDGQLLLSVSPAKNYTSIMISSSDLDQDETLEILYGGSKTGSSIDNTLYTGGSVTETDDVTELVLDSLILTISPDGSLTQAGGQMGGKPGGGMDRPRR